LAITRSWPDKQTATLGRSASRLASASAAAAARRARVPLPPSRRRSKDLGGVASATSADKAFPGFCLIAACFACSLLMASDCFCLIAACFACFSSFWFIASRFIACNASFGIPSASSEKPKEAFIALSFIALLKPRRLPSSFLKPPSLMSFSRIPPNSSLSLAGFGGFSLAAFDGFGGPLSKPAMISPPGGLISP